MENRIMKPVVIIGAGPAGMAAAIELAKAGVLCTVIDEALRPGGQAYKQASIKFQVQKKSELNSEQRREKKLYAEWLEVADKINLLSNTAVIGIWNKKEVVYTSESVTGIIEASQIIIAAGAYEHPVPFPGWTLPGVMTVSGVKSFIQTMHVKPGTLAVVAGTGPLIISAANTIHEAGIEVLAVLEAGNPPWSSESFLKEWGEMDFAKDIADDLKELHLNGIPILFNHTVFEANAIYGRNEITTVSFGPVDSNDWKPLKEQVKTEYVDLLAVGFGLVPNTELSELAGCRHEFYPGIGWFVARDEMMQTNVPGIFVVGDSAKISGDIIAEEEGRIAGIKAAENLCAISAEEAKNRYKKHFARLHSFDKFRNNLNEASAIRSGLLELITPETLVCRCEEVTLSEVNKAINEGAGDLQSVKLLTRLGMGPCQGRNCAPSMGMYICEKLKRTPLQVGRINPRPPVKPVTLGALAKMTGIKNKSQSDSFDSINTGGIV